MGIVEETRKKFYSAIYKFELIQPKDKIIVAVSGGKDSLVLFDLLYHAWKFEILDFQLFPVYVVPQIEWIKTYKNEIENIFKSYWIECIIQNMQIPTNSNLNNWLKWKKPCQWCSYTRRITLFKLAEKMKANKIAYGHHMDDIVTTIFMNVKNYKRLKIMPPLNKIRKGDFSIIRPLSLIREGEIVKYIKKKDFKPLKADCPREKNWERKKTQKVIEKIEEEMPFFVNNFFESYIKRLGNDYEFFS